MNSFKYIDNLSEICPNFDRIDKSCVYRLIKGTTPIEDDFVPLYYSTKRRYWKEVDDCKAKGLSLFENIEDIKHLLNNIPNQKEKYKSIYQGQIDINDGDIYKTPVTKRPSHRTFYAYDVCDELESFTKKVEEWN